MVTDGMTCTLLFFYSSLVLLFMCLYDVLRDLVSLKDLVS